MTSRGERMKINRVFYMPLPESDELVVIIAASTVIGTGRLWEQLDDVNTVMLSKGAKAPFSFIDEAAELKESPPFGNYSKHLTYTMPDVDYRFIDREEIRTLIYNHFIMGPVVKEYS